jgi:hypothetical protein
MTTLAFSLVSHTNVGKTTLARTLLGRDIGIVADAAHVTAQASRHELLRSPEGDLLQLWDTPGLGDSERLLRRLRQRANPLGWLVGEVWDRWREPALWAGQQLLLHLRSEGDLVLYLVNAAEPPQAAAHVQAELALLHWLARPLIVLLNQTGMPRSAAEEAQEVDAWRQALAAWPQVRSVLPLDAFARCWVQEGALWRAAGQALSGESQAAMARLQAAWGAVQQARFERAVDTLAGSAARLASQRQGLPVAAWGDRLRSLGRAAGRLVGRSEVMAGLPPLAQAEARLEADAAAELKACTDALIQLHGLDGEAALQLHERVADRYRWQRPLTEGQAAIGGVLSGALGGLAADLASGGLSLGAGVVAGGVLGALGSALAARGLNLSRGETATRARLAWSRPAWQAQLEALLLCYLAVAHYGRGRGGWVEGEAPAHWPALARQVLAERAPALDAAWARFAGESGERSDESGGDDGGDRDDGHEGNEGADGRARRRHERWHASLRETLAAALRELLDRLYPGATPWPAHNDRP